jgi:hypothetical protein
MGLFPRTEGSAMSTNVVTAGDLNANGTGVPAKSKDVRLLTGGPEFLKREPTSKPSDKPILSQSIKSSLTSLHKVEILFIDPPEDRQKSLGAVEIAPAVTARVRSGRMMFAIPRDDSGYVDTRIFPLDEIQKCRDLVSLRRLIVTEWGGVEIG